MFRPRALCQMKPAPPDENNINPHKSSFPGNYIENAPQYDGKTKEFPSKTKKPLQISTKAYLVNKIDRKYVEDIQPKEQMIDFIKLLSQFKTLEEVQALQASDLFDIDAETLEDLKKKCKEFTDIASYLFEEKEKAGQTEEAKSDKLFMEYLTNQSIEMQNNKINLDIVLNNIEKIKSLKYNDDGVKVYFKA